MRLAFAGTPEFAAVALRALCQAGHEVVGVLTQPDRPAGRGMALQMSAVKAEALARDVPLCQPRSLRLDGRFPEEAASARDWLQALAPEAMVVAAYGLLLPAWTLGLPARGCLNIHASLLPRWRGAAPIHRAIEAGDAVTGVTIMQMDVGLDTGDLLLEASLPIASDETTGTLHDRLAALGAAQIVLALARLDELQPRSQPSEGVSYAAKVDKSQALIDWHEPAGVIERRVRAFNPQPGAAFEWGGERIKLWKARVLPDGSVVAPAHLGPGGRLDAGPRRLVVVTGHGVLECLEIQRPGGRRLAVADWLQGADARASSPAASGR